jgi:tyrosinase
MWQEVDPDVRYGLYDGPKEDFRHKGGEKSSLEDMLYAGILGDDVQVADIIRADHGLLCYRY